MSFFTWPEINNFHTVRKYLKDVPELLGEQDSKVIYKCKTKLHGTNAAVQIYADGTVQAQSRTDFITLNNDNCGFARWVKSQEKEWAARRKDGREIIFFGEWCGSGIQKGVAINDIGKKVFAIFAVVIKKGDEIESFVTEPNDIWYYLKDRTDTPFSLKDVFVLNWHTYGEIPFEAEVDWITSAEKLQFEVNKINAAVERVEKCDPWVWENFGITGVGEGLVFYPVSHLGYQNFVNLAFKAKGEKHKVVNTKLPVQADPEIVNSVKEFADLVLTEARLEQGAKVVSGADNPNYDLKFIGKFLGWLQADVKKETVAELEASKLSWEQVSKQLIAQARQWYLDKSKKL